MVYKPTIIFFKECPRCEGDVMRNNDMYGEYVFCIHCGWSLDKKDKEGILESNAGNSTNSNTGASNK